MRKSPWSNATGGAALAIVFACIGCATSSTPLPISEPSLVQGQFNEQSDLESLRRGRALAVTECAECHRFYWPHEYSPSAWPGIVRNMGRLASLNKDQIRDVERYYVSASRAERDSEGTNPSPHDDSEGIR
jgi:hypothetical protein